MDLKRLREQGHKITILNEAQFWQLAEKPRPPAPQSGARSRVRAKG